MIFSQIWNFADDNAIEGEPNNNGAMSGVSEGCTYAYFNSPATICFRDVACSTIGWFMCERPVRFFIIIACIKK